MASFDAVTLSGGAASTHYSFSHTIGGGVTNGAVAVCVAFASTQTNTITVTVGGASAGLISGTDINTVVRSAIYGKATGSATGATTIVVDLNVADTLEIAALSASACDQTTPINNGTGQVVNFGTWPDTLSITSATDNLSFDFITTNSASTDGLGTNQTNKWSGVSNFTTLSFGNISTAGTATVSHTVTSTTNSNAGTHSGANFKNSAAAAVIEGAPSPPVTRVRLRAY